MKCPLNYGCDGELEESYRGELKLYHCKTCGNWFCDHILNATKKDLKKFSCNSCYADTIEACQCMDCEVFCSECNDFIYVSCSDVMAIMTSNEERRQ